MKENKIRCHPRGLARSVAHNKFEKQGFDNVDKPFRYRGRKYPSYFATHWRSVLVGEK